MEDSKQEIRIREYRGTPGICAVSRVQARSEGVQTRKLIRKGIRAEGDFREDPLLVKMRELAGRVTAHFGFGGWGTRFPAIRRVQKGQAGARGPAGS
jgi:hypothetical protein